MEPDGETLLTEDRIRLFLRVWPTEGKGWLGIVHGYGEHSGRYEAFARRMNERAWSVAACDLRGHGQSPGRRGHIRRFSDYLRDVAALHAALRARADGQPVFLLGHSLGGLILARHAGELEGLAGVILSAPFLRMAMRVPAWRRIAAPLLAQIWPSFSSPSGLLGAMVSHDPEVVAEYESDPLMHKRATARWFTEVLKAQRAAFDEAPQLDLPFLILHGTADPIASVSTTRHFFSSVGSPGKTLEVYGGFLHEVLNEIGKERVWEDIASWLDEHGSVGGER